MAIRCPTPLNPRTGATAFLPDRSRASRWYQPLSDTVNQRGVTNFTGRLALFVRGAAAQGSANWSAAEPRSVHGPDGPLTVIQPISRAASVDAKMPSR
jgi:hypothetical protein